MIKTHSLSQHRIISILIWVLPIPLFTLLTAVGAQVAIPLPWTPVPVTLQTCFVLLSGAWLGSTRGGLSQVLYVGCGVLGLPVFADASGGVSVLFGATGGYLIGFVLASFLMGKLSHDANSFLKWALCFWMSSLIIFVCGVSYLMMVLNVSFQKALVLGFYPFIIGDFLKIGLSSSIMTVKKRITF